MPYQKKYKIVGNIVTTVCSFLIVLLVFGNTTIIESTATEAEEQEIINSVTKQETTTEEATKDATIVETTKPPVTTTERPTETKKETTTIKKEPKTTEKAEQTTKNTVQSQFDTVLDDLPSDLKRCFKEQGWGIRLVSKPIPDTSGTISVVYAVTDMENKEIRVSTKCPVIRETIHHELGHFVDNVTGYRSYFAPDGLHEDAFSERSNLPTPKGQKRSHCIGTKGEYFASSFALYLENPNELKRLCPNTYKLVDQSYKQLINGDIYDN